MSIELKTHIINDDDSYMEESKNNFLNNRCFKKIDKKYKIGLAIFIAIILGLLFILIILAFHSSPVKIIQENLTKEREETEESDEEEEKKEIKFLNPTPKFKNYNEILSNLPYTLTTNENGIIDNNYVTLKNVLVDKLKRSNDSCYEFRSFEINEESKISSSDNYDLTLSFDYDMTFHSDFKFNVKIEEITKGSKNVSYIMITKKLASISIPEEDIELKDYYKEKIEDIANETYSDEEKKKKLDKLFTGIGYFIPRKIIIGGYLYEEISQIENENIKKIINDIKGNINYEDLFNSSAEYNYLNEQVFKYLLSEKKIKIVGGDSSKKSFDEWEKSVNDENAKIIGHSSKMSIIDLIDNSFNKDIKNKLKEPLKFLSEKYDKRKNYSDALSNAKTFIIPNTIEGQYNKNNGICKNDNLIYTKTKHIWEAGTVIVDITFDDIVVGWYIKSCWGNDGTNGNYNFNDPILSKKIYFTFTSQYWWWIFGRREQCYDLEIFLMKRPE